MQTVFILGPSLDNVTEPEPAIPAAPGRRGVEFGDPATEPGGLVHLKLTPAVAPEDLAPVNVYAFYVNPPSSVPPPEERTPEWFFQSSAGRGSASTVHGPDAFDIQAIGVTPGVYHVQTVLEYPAA